MHHVTFEHKNCSSNCLIGFCQNLLLTVFHQTFVGFTVDRSASQVKYKERRSHMHCRRDNKVTGDTLVLVA